MQLTNRSPVVESQAGKIGIDLARWYSGQSTIRRLLAVDSSPALTICVALEPTPDGGDSLPIWLAMQDKWTTDLRTLANCDVQLKLVASDSIDDIHSSADANVIAHICWRDPSATP